jgi:gliding motility-associated lipoprotein GldD
MKTVFKANKAYIIICIVVILLLGISCKRDYTPKPKAYFRIDLPEKEYQKLAGDYPFSFEYPKYSKIVKDTMVHAEKYWINVEFPKYKGIIHLSYKSIHNNLNQYIEDSRTLAYKHTIKAEAINENVYSNPDKKVYGLLYEIKGETASSLQFYVTDSARHFIRGALYFEARPNKDSLAPVIEFFRKDILHLIETIQWEN